VSAFVRPVPHSWFLELIEVLATGSSDDVSEWMASHELLNGQFRQYLETMPRVTAVVVRTLAGKMTLGADESWGMVARRSSSQPERQAAQLLTAALNDDDDAITGIVAGILESPEEHIARVSSFLIFQSRGMLLALADKVRRS
jgi:hypothetical protein